MTIYVQRVCKKGDCSAKINEMVKEEPFVGIVVGIKFSHFWKLRLRPFKKKMGPGIRVLTDAFHIIWSKKLDGIPKKPLFNWIGGGGGVFVTIWRFNCYFLSLLGTFHACFLAYIECRSTTKWGLVRLAASPLRIFVGALRINLPICLFLDCSIVPKINWTHAHWDYWKIWFLNWLGFKNASNLQKRLLESCCSLLEKCLSQVGWIPKFSKVVPKYFFLSLGPLLCF